MKHVDLAVFDLDNTLYDWYAAFLPAFYQMVDFAAQLLHCEEELLLSQLKAVHVRHHDVEHPYGLFETEIVQARVEIEGADQVWRLLNPAFYAFNKTRKNELRLFPHVRETLDELKGRGVRLVAFTDSKYFSAVGRVARLELGDVFDRLYCREKSISELPPSPFPGYRPEPIYNISAAKVAELPSDEAKPDPRVLQDIVLRERTTVASTAYIGDSLAKDVMMARAAVRVFGRPVRELWLAENWFRYPRTSPASGMVGVRRHHVFVLESYVSGDVWMVYDANSGHRATRIHARSISGYAIVNPRG